MDHNVGYMNSFSYDDNGNNSTNNDLMRAAVTMRTMIGVMIWLFFPRRCFALLLCGTVRHIRCVYLYYFGVPRYITRMKRVL